jgi:RHS repeat-associated protein
LRLRTISVNGANAVTYAYDADSLLRQAGSLVLNRDPETGLLSSTTLGNVTTSYTYNGFGELASMTASFGATPLYSEAYTRDALGRIVTRVETIQGATTTYEYGYDAAGRLETVTKNGLLASQYAYDANGNRLAKQTPTVFEAGTYDAQDRMLTYAGASYTYTANGETLTKTDATGTTSYQYDVFGNLLGVDLPNGTQIRYKVDGRNRRIERSVNGVVTQRWLWQGQLSPIAELNSSNAVVSRFVYATRVNVPDSMIRSGTTYRIVTDYLGSPRLVVNVSSGAIAQRFDFDEWGIATSDTNPGFQPFGFAGSIGDEVVGLWRLGARDLSPSSGRWTSLDRSGFAGGDSNLFAYALSNPIDYQDPTGDVGIAGFLVGAGIELGIQLFESGGRWDCVDWLDVGISGGVSAAGAGLLSVGQKASRAVRSAKATRELSRQLSRTRSGSRATKLEGRIAQHDQEILDAALAAGVYQLGRGLKDATDDPTDPREEGCHSGDQQSTAVPCP